MSVTVQSVRIPIEPLRQLLADLPNCVLLRNEDLLANLSRGGDIDVFVSDPAAAEQSLIRALGIPRIVIRRSYVVGYYYDWGHVDVLPRVEWRGAAYVPTDALLAQATGRDGCPQRPDPAHEALICWFSSLLWGGFFKDRYSTLIVTAAREHAAAMKAACTYAAGRRWGERLCAAAADGRPDRSAHWVKAVRRAVRWQALRREPAATIRNFARFWRRELDLRRKPPVPSIAFLGPDGCGKSSVISRIAVRLGPPLSNGVHVCHWRPGRIKPPDDAAQPVVDPHGKPPRGQIASMLKLGFLMADWFVGYWGSLVHLRAKGKVLLFDRHYIDILVDPKRYRYGGSRRLASLVASCIAAPDILIVLDAPVSVLRSRKQEVHETEIARQRSAYRALAASVPGSYVIDATQPLEEVVEAVGRVILGFMTESTAQALRTAVLPSHTCPMETNTSVTPAVVRSAAESGPTRDQEDHG